MKYNITQAARIVGITRKTFYNHIEKRGISVERDTDGKQLIDASELIRVYGDKCCFDEPEKQPDAGQGTQRETAGNNSDALTRIAVLEERLSHTELQRDHFERLFEQEREERKTGTRLLADQRSKQEKWESAFEQLQQQVARENEALKELQDFKLETTRRLMLYRKALKAERSKTLWQRLFAGEKKKRGVEG